MKYQKRSDDSRVGGMGEEAGSNACSTSLSLDSLAASEEGGGLADRADRVVFIV